MIGIKEITRGRFGNRVFQYSNLLQLSKKFNKPCFCQQWEGNEWFEDVVTTEIPNNSYHTLNWDILRKNEHIKLLNDNENCVLGGVVIHNLFFELTHVEPRSLIKIKKEFLPDFVQGTTNVGIHIRGGDILLPKAEGREIHSFEYYKNSIDEIIRETAIDTLHICTDDLSFNLVPEVYEYAKSVLGEKVVYGKSTTDMTLPHIYDFALLSECDYLIAGSSTYSSAAALLGKEKRLIHSLEWLLKNVDGESYVKWGNYTTEYPEPYWRLLDNFWSKVYNGGNEFYKSWKII